MVLKIGLVGCGEISHAHREAMKRQRSAAFTAFCDRDTAKAKEAAEQERGNAYSDVEWMLADERLDGLVICTPPGVRTALIEAAASRDLPILCEKPPAITLEMARRTEGVIRKYDAMVSVAFLFRYYPIVERLRELIAERPVVFVRSRYLGNVANNASFKKLKPWYRKRPSTVSRCLNRNSRRKTLLRWA